MDTTDAAARDDLNYTSGASRFRACFRFVEAARAQGSGLLFDGSMSTARWLALSHATIVAALAFLSWDVLIHLSSEVRSPFLLSSSGTKFDAFAR